MCGGDGDGEAGGWVDWEGDVRRWEDCSADMVDVCGVYVSRWVDWCDLRRLRVVVL